MTDLSRRHLIQGAVAAGAALAGSGVAVAASKQKWDETVDVIVIGSGFAGLAAAIEAKKAGANVVVLEKMATFGGNSIINGGILTATAARSRSSTRSRTPWTCSRRTFSRPATT